MTQALPTLLGLVVVVAQLGLVQLVRLLLVGQRLPELPLARVGARHQVMTGNTQKGIFAAKA